MTTTKVARDLTKIEELNAGLLAQAISRAAARVDGISLPGGLAMVALAHVGNNEIHERRLALYEQHHMLICLKLDHTRCWTGSEDEDEDDAPILQTLLFWSEQWRQAKGFPLAGRRPTVASEVNVIRGLLDWAWDNEPRWDAFAADIAAALSRLENIVHAGTRVAFRGVPCMYDECRGASLIRKTVPARGEDGEKTWVLTDWHCPNCKRSWDEVGYASMVAAATESLHYANIGDEAWCSLERAAQHVSRPRLTIWSWADRNQITSICRIADRKVFVHIADLTARNQLAAERAGRRKVKVLAPRTTAV